MTKSTRTKTPRDSTSAAEVLTWLQRHGAKKNIASMERFGIEAPHAFGVTVGDLRRYAKQLGTNHSLATELWEHGWYESRLLAVFVDDPELVTPQQMDAWATDFDNWAIVDTACFHLFDHAPKAWQMIAKWARAKPEFKKRSAFALLWSLSVHDKQAANELFLDRLPLIERGALDERHFVKKAVNMALRAIGKRNTALNQAAIEVAKRLANQPEPHARWVGKHALRELQGPNVQRRLKR